MADNKELKNNPKSFRDAFRKYSDNYTVIGGTACMILIRIILMYLSSKQQKISL